MCETSSSEGRYSTQENARGAGNWQDCTALSRQRRDELWYTAAMRLFLAPMEGVVDHHLRHILTTIGGIDLCVTEFVRVCNTPLPEKVFKRYSPELLINSPDLLVNSQELGVNRSDEKTKLPLSSLVPTRVQLLGSNPEMLAHNAAKAARMGAPGIDLNFGCPAKVVNKHRGGACLLQEPETLYAIVSAVREAVPNHIPVTAKIRLGYEERSGFVENAQALESAGAAELVVHARSKADGYRPPAYWESIGEIRHSVAINVVANGEIWSVEDYRRCKSLSGCKDFMLGRGLLARPDLALAIKADNEGKDYSALNWSDVASYLMQFLLLTCDAYPKKYMGNRVKQWLFYLQKHYEQASILFENIKKSRDFEVIHGQIAKQMQDSAQGLNADQIKPRINATFS